MRGGISAAFPGAYANVLSTLRGFGKPQAREFESVSNSQPTPEFWTPFSLSFGDLACEGSAIDLCGFGDVLQEPVDARTLGEGGERPPFRFFHDFGLIAYLRPKKRKILAATES